MDICTDIVEGTCSFFWGGIMDHGSRVLTRYYTYGTGYMSLVVQKEGRRTVMGLEFEWAIVGYLGDTCYWNRCVFITLS